MTKALGVSTQPLRNWDKTGKISTIRTPTGLRRYDLITYSNLDAF
ncbi:MerR family DNA-binding transcriptional regulator [Geminocystis sp. CENA526]